MDEIRHVNCVLKQRSLYGLMDRNYGQEFKGIKHTFKNLDMEQDRLYLII